MKMLDKLRDFGVGFYIGQNPWQDSGEKKAQQALVKIVELLGDQQLSGLGRDVLDIALKGLR